MTCAFDQLTNYIRQSGFYRSFDKLELTAECCYHFTLSSLTTYIQATSPENHTLVL